MQTHGIDLLAALTSPQTSSRLRLVTRPAFPGPLPPVRELLAGAAQADLTPPPGLPKAGYSRNAHTGTGFRTRLRATVLHLRCGRTSLAIVATDLLGGSALVQQLVAAQVAELTDVPLSGVWLSATHTHGAPGQFHGTDFYNRFSSNRPGLDPDWTAFVAAQISAAVIEAVQTRAPAALAWGRTEVRGFTRNRSLPAYQRNPGQEQTPAGAAINPALDLLRVDSIAPDGGTAVLAALAFFSVHGTAVPMTSRGYNADLWAYLCAELGQQVAGTHGPVIVGAVQGTHGDVTPALEAAAGHPEAARIGRGIGAAAAGLYGRLDGPIEQPEARQPALGFAFREVDLAAGPEAGGILLPRRPAVGASLLGGARENETPIVSQIPPFRAGWGKTRLTGSPQAQKWVVGSRWLQPLILPLNGFPRVLPVHLLRVGEVLLTGLPMEITTETGRRVAAGAEQAWTARPVSGAAGRRAGAEAAGPGGVRAVVCSVVDEYAGYCTTEQEYTLQYYEGGHTLYGPRTQRFVAAVVADLARRLSAGDDLHEALPVRRFDLTVRRYLASSSSAAASSAASGSDPAALRRSLGEPAWARAGDEACLEWTWQDAAPRDLAWHHPMVSLELPDGGLVTDAHGELEVEHRRGLPGGRGRGSAAHVYTARWFAPGQGQARQPTGYRFVLAAGLTSARPGR